MTVYNIIYADPPWHYNSRRRIRKDGGKPRFGIGACNHYPVMKTKDICKLDVKSIAADNCALFLWTTFPRLDAGLEVMKAWGFDYKTIGFLWVKLNPGMAGLDSGSLTPHLHKIGLINFLNWLAFFGIGYYTKSNPELCLLGVKGKMKPISNCVSNTVFAPREYHSKKPDIVRDKIVELFGDVPRIELFAREVSPGWDVFGNEVPNSIDLGGR